MRWLIPRLDSFRSARADTEVTVTTTTTLQEELRGGFDLAIGGGPSLAAAPRRAVPARIRHPGREPALLARHPLEGPGDLDGHVLLGTQTRPGDWGAWLAAAGASRPAGARPRVFDHFFVTLQAVEDGAGLGIGPFPVLDHAVGEGRLAAPFPQIVVERPGYFVLTPFDADKSPALSAFIDWLVAEGNTSLTVLR